MNNPRDIVQVDKEKIYKVEGLLHLNMILYPQILIKEIRDHKLHLVV